MPILDEDTIRGLVADFRRDHADLLRKVEGLEQVLTRLSRESGQAPTETATAVGEAAAFFQCEFLAHARDEDLLLFPSLQPYADAASVLPGLVAEHQALREQMDAFAQSLGEVALRGLRIAQLLHRHVEHEESVLADLTERMRPSEVTNQEVVGGG